MKSRKMWQPVSFHYQQSLHLQQREDTSMRLLHNSPAPKWPKSERRIAPLTGKSISWLVHHLAKSRKKFACFSWNHRKKSTILLSVKGCVSMFCQDRRLVVHSSVPSRTAIEIEITIVLILFSNSQHKSTHLMCFPSSPSPQTPTQHYLLTSALP